jgi:hypothetical protein
MKWLCKLLGHRWRMLGWRQMGNGRSTVTGWRCERCDVQDTQQWDWTFG